MKGRIFFPGNPWPAGHPLTSLTIGGRLVPNEGLYLYLTLTSEDYDTEFKFKDIEYDEDNIIPDWQAPVAWINYQKCWIGPSQTSQYSGFLVSDGSKPFDIMQSELNFVVDTLPKTVSDISTNGAFGCYIQGHDAVADHHISLNRTGEFWSVLWKGKVAEAYCGKEEFEHDFLVEAEGIKFDGISLWAFDPEIAKAYYNLDLNMPNNAADLLDKYIINSTRFNLERRNNNLFASWS